jgi:hypothetical protein
MNNEQIWVVIFLTAFVAMLAISAWAQVNKKDDVK